MTVEEAYKKGLIKKGQFFYKKNKRKILKNSIHAKKLKYRSYYQYELYRFKGIDVDGRYDFEVLADFREDQIVSLRWLVSMGKGCIFDLKPLRNIKFY